MATSTLYVTVAVGPDDLPLLKHELVEINGVLAVLDAPSSAEEGADLEGLLAAAEVAADHYRDEAEYFEREGERETADSFGDLERNVRDLIAKSAPLVSVSADPLLVKIQQLLDEDRTGIVRDTLWDLVENS